MRTETNKVIICEDDEAIAEIIHIILTEKGYTVDIVMDGKSALSKIVEDPPGLILVDLWMPGMSGEEIVTKVKQDEKLSNIQVIILSASREMHLIADKLGISEYLSKPFDITELEEKVEKLLPLN